MDRICIRLPRRHRSQRCVQSSVVPVPGAAGSRQNLAAVATGRKQGGRLPRPYICVATGADASLPTDREGFEPSKRFHVYTLSRRAPSTARPPVQYQKPENKLASKKRSRRPDTRRRLEKTDRERFELSIPLRVCRFSRPVHSTALPPVQIGVVSRRFHSLATYPDATSQSTTLESDLTTAYERSSPWGERNTLSEPHRNFPVDRRLSNAFDNPRGQDIGRFIHCG